MNAIFRRYRKYLGINLKTAANEIGISHTTLADLENGHKDIIKNKTKWKAYLKYVKKIEKKVHPTLKAYLKNKFHPTLDDV
mgnify:CR=1 FL=1